MHSRIIVAVVAAFAALGWNGSLASSFGRTAGQLGVSASGAAQYSIPIWAPPGPRGMQPRISINYNSQSGIGYLGLGWFLGGLPSINRCNKTYAQDTIPAPVALVMGDGYCIKGNRLRLTSGTYGLSGSTYQTEIADFTNITAEGIAGNGPAYFTVQDRNGLKYEYGFVDGNGNGAGSQVLATGTSTAASWLLSKVIDQAGNNYVINYTTLSGSAVPNKILWTPTSLGAASYTYTMQFNYTTNVPQGTVYKYLGGTVVTNNQLLTSIEILNGSTVLKDYFLSYQASAATGRNELNSVQECADSAQSNCLLPTSVGYQPGSAGVSTTTTSALTSSGYGLSARYDLNGDGIPDLVYTDNSNITHVAFGSATGYGTPVSTGIYALLTGNLNGGSQDGFLAVVSGYWWYYSWNGSSFVGASTGLAYDSTAYQYQLADVDGDGRPDLISLYSSYDSNLGKTTLTLYTRLNTSSGGAVSFAAGATLTNTLSDRGAGGMLLTPDGQYGKLRRLDFNGDGRDDLAIELIRGQYPNFTTTDYEMISTGGATAFTLAQIFNYNGEANSAFFADWNDDACTDYVALGTLYISPCNGSTPAATIPLGAVVLAALDWDGDGRTDLIVANGSTLGVLLSTGAGITTLQTTSIPYSSTCQYVAMDAYGRGLDDLGCWSQTAPSPLTFYAHNAKTDLATSFTDGYQVAASSTYVPLSDSAGAYIRGSSAVFPNRDFAPALYAVSSYSNTDGIGGSFTENYQYSGAVLNLQGRGFEGFNQIRTQDSRTGIYDFHGYSTTFPTASMTTSDTVTQSNTSKKIKVFTPHISTQTLDATTNNERYFTYDDTETTQGYEVGSADDGVLTSTQVKTYNTPDGYGNFASVGATVTDNDSASPYYNQSWTSSASYTIAPDHGVNWCLSLPTEIDTTNTPPPPTPAITRHVSYSPDYTNCRETQQVIEPSSGTYKVTSAYGFDSFGNINSRTITGVGMAARTTGMLWGTTGQFPTQITNALNQVSYPTYDPNSGKPASFKDPNGISISWQYDPFQRKMNESRPDGTSTTWAYNNCATAGCVNSNNRMSIVQTRLNHDNSILTVSNSYYDAFNRLLISSKQMLNSQYDRNEVQYDNLGNVHLQGMPCTFISCVQYWITNTFDVLNRLTLSERPISASNPTLESTTYAYQGRTTTVTDPQGKLTTTITKVTGRLGRTKDHNGYYVNFTDDAFGSLLSVTDSLSNTLRTMTYAYGTGAFLTSLTDMDLGTRSYTPDALGEVTAYSDGKGNNFSATYDALSRMTSRTEPDLATSWTWGTTAASYNIGKLASVASVATAGTHSESFAYDNAGHTINHTLVSPTDGSRAFDYGYGSNTGLFRTLTYPASYPSTYRLKAGFNYIGSVLQEVFDNNSSTTWWIANTANPRGQVTQETTEDASGDPHIVVNSAFDAVTGWLSTVKAGVGSGAALQNEAYLYDYVGNVTQRQDNNLGLTENIYYDNLYRLDHSTLAGVTNLQMAYDAMGDITSRSDVAGGATWTYDPVRKHAVTQAGSSSNSYTYDANGNATSRNGTTNGWTSYNYPSGVGTSSESASFDYGPDRQRWRMIYTGASGVETTYYATNLFEVVHTAGGTDYRHYIYGGAKPVMVISRTAAGAVNARSLLTNQQGSISSIVADATGSSYVSESFTAFGNRREASTWSGPPTTTERNTMDGVTREGYTFQTVLGSMGLNHMNGRVQDAVIGRFISPDPATAEPENTQSWNRYSYVNNNPVTNTDPSGFCDTEPRCILPDNPQPPPPPPPPPPDREQFAMIGSESDCIGNCGISYGVGYDTVNGSLTDISRQVYIGSKQNTQTFIGSWHSDGTWGDGENPGFDSVGFGPLTAGFGGAGLSGGDGGGGGGGGGVGAGTTAAPTAPQPQSQNSIKNWLCHAGNSLASASDSLGNASGKLELAGVGIGVAGLVTAQPEVAAPGFALAATGGIGSIGAGALQFGAGLLQGFGGGGFGNSFGAVATLGASATIGRFITGPGVSGYRTVSQRATDSFLQNSATTTGGAFDTLTSFIEQLSPQQVGCP